jgi:hypothetical protein
MGGSSGASADMPVFGLVVIGAGPAGLACAISAASAASSAAASAAAGKGLSSRPEGREPFSVLVLEKMPRPGIKLLATGSGRCNITHSGEMSDFLLHYGAHGRFLKPALLGFSNENLLDFFGSGGLSFVTEEDGKIFPASGKAGEVLGALRVAAGRLGVGIPAGTPARSIAWNGSGFDIFSHPHESEGEEARGFSSGAVECGAAGKIAASGSPASFRARKVCIATGGASYPDTGSSGDGYALAAALGHGIVDPAPCLSPATVQDWNFADCSGYALRERRISLFREGKKVAQGKGDILFTHTGLSGPGILDLSRDMRQGDLIVFSLVEDGRDAGEALLEEIEAHGKREIRTVLGGLGLPEKLARALVLQAGIDPAHRACDLSRPARKALAVSLCACSLRVSALGDFSRAMATRGGVELSGVNPRTMESRLRPGLYFAGEVLDVDGDTGGYNLQAAFSTGHLAGRSAARSPD